MNSIHYIHLLFQQGLLILMGVRFITVVLLVETKVVVHFWFYNFLPAFHVTPINGLYPTTNPTSSCSANFVQLNVREHIHLWYVYNKKWRGRGGLLITSKMKQNFIVLSPTVRPHQVSSKSPCIHWFDYHFSRIFVRGLYIIKCWNPIQV